MRVHIRLFASLRETIGRGELELELPPGATADSAWRALSAEYPALAGKRASLAAAVNRRYVGFDSTLQDGDEVVFVPPVSGGSGDEEAGFVSGPAIPPIERGSESLRGGALDLN